jgi:FkbM family methyltransferase
VEDQRELALLRLPNGDEVTQINATETRYLYQEIYVDQIYGNGESLALPDNALVVDAGANIGLFAKYVHQLQPTARVLSVEPAPDCYRALASNVSQLTGVVTENCALGATDSMVDLTYYPGYSMMSTLHPAPEEAISLVMDYARNTTVDPDAEDSRLLLGQLPALMTRRLAPTPIRVHQRRLDDLLDRTFPDRSIDFLKVDVEGAELDVLEGLGRRGESVRRAAVEVQGDPRLASVEALLRDWGLTTVVTQQSGYEGTDLYMVQARR